MGDPLLMKFIGKDKKVFEELLEKAENVFEGYEIGSVIEDS